MVVAPQVEMEMSVWDCSMGRKVKATAYGRAHRHKWQGVFAKMEVDRNSLLDHTFVRLLNLLGLSLRFLVNLVFAND